MKRGTLAIENMGFVNKKKQKEQLQELASKQQTMAHLRMGEQVALQRHLAQADAQAAKKQENSRVVKAQIEENRKIAEKLRQEELNQHLLNLQMQDQMFINRQKNLDKQKVEIQQRTASMENYF